MYDPPPERPSESDCCGTGCVPCVLDLYDEEYARWQRRQNSVGDQLRRDLLSVTKYKAYKIVSIQQLTDDVYKYTFGVSPPTEGRLPIIFTQHTNISVDYTPISLSDKCAFDAIIKVYPNGQFTKILLKKKTNDIIFVRGPSGGIDYKGYDSIVMFCGGTGIAAFLGLIRSILENNKCDILLRLHYSCKTLDSILMRKTLAEHAAYWNCAVFIYLSREHNWSECTKSFWFNENIVEGRISQDIIKDIVDKQQNSKTLWLICGNNAFNQYIFTSLKNYNAREDSIQLFHNTIINSE
ncbi:Oxidoreductase-like, N-terminal,Riboflavin synthase-like beta-barrel,NADH:cytochrome b5 reductase [Cinara cedri]|uniref:Oxidoreductase-like, N-terminal,Riboflavin synthase-like beta-barrel,NADH:cytochrome b5 reductase n=1 Tax=Cinara cedri TaxID=506608 RepID=A0A5E4N223_9HEMI|nr:Oxidoreductase-like, N-terminal,Riboflavin synthase-like beta-barrel,NADH:cytochrome b5 reductase [Cinara cedri]